ncbi:hypothetical protein ACQ4M4_19205 [Leptolyngbya sp. AN02str]
MSSILITGFFKIFDVVGLAFIVGPIVLWRSRFITRPIKHDA